MIIPRRMGGGAEILFVLLPFFLCSDFVVFSFFNVGSLLVLTMVLNQKT